MIEQIAFIISTTLIYSTAYIYASMGGIINENSGVINIGLEGLMVVGAFFGATVSFWTGNPWLGFLFAGVSASLMALLHAFNTITLKMNDIISGIAINLLGPGIAFFLSRLFFEQSLQTPILSTDAKMPRLFDGIFEQFSLWDIIFNQYITVYFAIFLVLLVWIMLYKTKLGFRIRAVGEHPLAAVSAGINARRVRYYAVLISGFLAGLGGASLSIALVSRFSPTLVSGHGFIALAAMIFGRWRPEGALIGCFLFGFAQAIVISLPIIGLDVSSYSYLLSALPYVTSILVLIFFVKRGLPPSSLGEKI